MHVICFFRYSYFFALTSISKKSIGIIFSREKKGYFYGQHFMVVVVTSGPSYIVPKHFIKLARIKLEGFCSPCLTLIRELESQYSLMLLMKWVMKDQPNWSKECIEFGFKFEYQYLATFIKMEGKAWYKIPSITS